MKWLVSALVLLVPASLIAQVPPPPRQPQGASRPAPRMYVPQRIRDLGKIYEGDTLPVTWRIENHGNADLVIDRTHAGCGCTVVRLTETEKTIPPGGMLELKAEFDSLYRRGLQNRPITVYSNDPTEPELNLELKAQVEGVFDVVPSGMVNLRNVRRGDTASLTVDFLPAEGRKELVLKEIKVMEEGGVSYRDEPLPVGPTVGRRLHLTIDNDVALGALRTGMAVKILADGIERHYEFPIRAEVVGDLAWQPIVIDATRQKSPPGRRLSPLTIRSTDTRPIEIVSAEAGPWLDVAVEPGAGRPGTSYSLFLTIRDQAPGGPFADTLRVRTSSLDQPLVIVPVFGIIASPVDVDPPLVLLRQDDTPIGTRRRVRLLASPQETLDVSAITCDNPAVAATLIHADGHLRLRHRQFIDVQLAGTLPPGLHETELKVKTSLANAEELVIPVVIEVPESR